MNKTVIEESPPIDTQIEGDSGEKNDKSGKASQGAEAVKESTEKSKKKETKMAEKKKEKGSKKAPAKKVAEKKPVAKPKKNKLPPGVTLKPQHNEHMDMELIKESPPLMDAYVKVSDNLSGLHGNKQLEMKVKKFCDEYSKIDWENEKNPGKLLKKLKDLTIFYTTTLNVADSTMSGIACKSHIRQGMLLLLQKPGVKAIGKKWEKWFDKNYNKRKLRSAVNYMSVAEIPNAIRYAIFGLTRLKKMKEVIKITAEDPDPIYTFLSKNKLVFDPECDNPIDEFNKEVDAAVAETLVKKIEEKNKLDYGIQAGLINKTVMEGVSFDNKVIRNINLIHESGGDVNDYLKRRYINKGKEFDVIENENKAKGFRKMVAEIKETVEVFSGDLTKLKENVDDDQIDTLEKALTELKRLKNI